MSRPLEAGERVLVLDARGRRFLIRLEAGATFHFHAGALPHDDLIGAPEGRSITTNTGARLRVFRPRLADFVLKMSRGAQVIYPKDIGAILMDADVYPGARVLEAGTGSGALTIALIRAVGERGRVVSYEIREDHAAVAADNVASFFGSTPPTIDLRTGDVREVAGTDERFDRAVLDVPQPWDALEAVTSVLEPGGVLCGYVPTTPQVQSLVVAMGEQGYAEVQTIEVLQRGWHVTRTSVRPDHRMVAHTGFLTVGRLGPAG
ncbi:MAG TPA: tRNA (adenine-N1)-methyltransferase [Actinomycetota bacterium]|nr:tRNA (adenine-N1)-methyltransferase [Actinomycetota bacterium]